MKSPILTTSKHKINNKFINVDTLDYGGPGVQITVHSKTQFVARFTGLKLDLQTWAHFVAFQFVAWFVAQFVAWFAA